MTPHLSSIEGWDGPGPFLGAQPHIVIELAEVPRYLDVIHSVLYLAVGTGWMGV